MSSLPIDLSQVPTSPLAVAEAAIAAAMNQTPVPTADSQKSKSKVELPASVLATVNAVAELSETFEQEMQAGDGSSVTTSIRVTRRQAQLFQLLRKHSLYAFPRMEVGVGSVSTTIAAKDLGLSDGQISKLSSLGSKKGVEILMFPQLKKAGQELRELLQELKDERMTFTGGLWICTDKELAANVVGLQAIQDRCAELLEQVVASIPEQRRQFLTLLAEFVHETNQHLEKLKQEQINLEQTLLKYRGKFPSENQVRKWLKFEYDGPDLIPSLAEQAEGSVQLQEAINRLNSAEMKADELNAVRRAFEQRNQQLQDAVARGIEYAETRMLKTVAEMMERLNREELEPGKLAPRTKWSLTNALSDMRNMLNMPYIPETFEELFQDAERLANLANQEGGSKVQLQQQIDSLITKMSGKFDFDITPAEQGHRAVDLPDLRKTDAAPIILPDVSAA